MTFRIKKFRRSKNSQSGVTLLLSLLVLAAILGITFSLASVTLVEIRSSGDLIRTEPAYYAADAVSEEALFKVRRNLSNLQMNYSTSLNNVQLPAPAESLLTTPIFQTRISHTYNSFNSTRSNFPIFDANCPVPTGTTGHCATGGSGYGRIQITYLDTGNTDTLRLYLCEFDARKAVDPTEADTSAYATLPCSNPNPSSALDNYWLVNNGSLYNTISANVRTVTLNPYLQQELILFNSGGTEDIHVQIETEDLNGVVKGLPLVGSKAVDITASASGIVRKIRTTIPTRSSTGASLPSYYVNFQPSFSPVPPNYQADNGLPFSALLGYGWDTTLESRQRNVNSDPLLDTFVFTPGSTAVWNYTIPNGNYLISLASGDPDYGHGPQRVVVEGVTAVNDVTTTPNTFATVSGLPVTVNDGSLTVTIGGGGGVTILNYIRIVGN